MSDQHYIGKKSLPFDEYKKAPGVNKSLLDHLHPTPAHCRAHMDEPVGEPTPAQIIGQLTHSALLDPDSLDRAIAVKPVDFGGRTKAGKEWLEQHSSRVVVTMEDYRNICGMIDAVRAHPIAVKALRGSEFEQSLFIPHNETKLLRKCRPDIITRGNAIADLKTCEDASEREFARSISNYRYHVQAAYYLDIANALAMEKQAFVFIVVEKRRPWAVAVYNLHPGAIEYGRREYENDLRVFAKCQREGAWPGYPTECLTIDLPRWAQKEAA